MIINSIPRKLSEIFLHRFATLLRRDIQCNVNIDMCQASHCNILSAMSLVDNRLVDVQQSKSEFISFDRVLVCGMPTTAAADPRGAPLARTTPPLPSRPHGPKFFKFHAVFWKICEICMLAPPSGGLAPPSTKNPGSAPAHLYLISMHLG